MERNLDDLIANCSKTGQWDPYNRLIELMKLRAEVQKTEAEKEAEVQKKEAEVQMKKKEAEVQMKKEETKKAEIVLEMEKVKLTRDLKKAAHQYSITDASMIGQRVIGLRSIKADEFDKIKQAANTDFVKKVAEQFTDEYWAQLYHEFQQPRKELAKKIVAQQAYAQLRTWSHEMPEAWSQFFMTKLFSVMERISHELSLDHLNFLDISKSSEIRDIHNRKAKIDGTLLSSKYLSWMTIASCFEVKREIKSKNLYESALGQLTDRITHLREFQDARNLFYGFVCSFNHVEFIKFSMDDGYLKVESTGKLELIVDSTNRAFQLLCGLYLSKPGALGHSPAVTPNFAIAENENLTFSDFEWIYSVERSPVSCRILMANAESGRQVIIKAAKDREKEVEILKLMNAKGVTGIPKVIYDKVVLSYPESIVLHGFAMLPVASRFPDKPTISFVVKILDGVLNTLIQVKSLGYMYTDLSNGNILNVDGESVLVDWQHTVPVGSPTRAFTFHYASLRIIFLNLHNQRPVHSMRDNLEALFFVALDQLSNGRYAHRTTDNIPRDTDAKIAQILFNFELNLKKHVRHPTRIQFLNRFHGLLYSDATPNVLSPDNMDEASELQLIGQVQSLFKQYMDVEIEIDEDAGETHDETADEDQMELSS